MDFCHGIQNWDSWRVASLRKPFLARGELSGWLRNQDPDVWRKKWKVCNRFPIVSSSAGAFMQSLNGR